jgi:pimeloyl-ACP methyl ester carboxylesterase
MVPAKYVLLDEMPKTINGKIDRFALPSPEVSVTALTAAKRGPRNEWEQFLKEVWEEVLQLSGIGIDDDFFLLGGSSLLVTRVIAKVVRKRQIVIPVRDFFANPTIAALSEQMSALALPSTAHGSRGWLRRTLPELRPIGVPASGIRLSAMHYPPVPQESLPTGPGRLVIVCPSYAHEQVRAYRNLQQLSVLLAQKGFHVVRFDYGGTGDSEGTAERVSLECWADDLQHVIAYFRQQLGHVPLSLVSHRLGAAVVQAAGIRNALQHVAWDPVLDGPAYAALIQRFHDYELRSRTLFLGRRHSRPDERMGYAWPEHFADELATFHWEPQLIEGQVGAVVWSKGMNSAKLSVPRWHEFFTDDEIYWDMVKWKNSAFSSPAAFGTIVDLLEGNS